MESLLLTGNCHRNFSIRKTDECDTGGACPLSEAIATRGV